MRYALVYTIFVEPWLAWQQTFHHIVQYFAKDFDADVL